MAIVDDFPAIKAAMNRHKPAEREMEDTFYKLSPEEQAAILADPKAARRWGKPLEMPECPRCRRLIAEMIGGRHDDRHQAV